MSGAYDDFDVGMDSRFDFEKMRQRLGVVGTDPTGGEDVGSPEDDPIVAGTFRIVDQMLKIAAVLFGSCFVFEPVDNLFSEIHESLFV